jgi:hypothetical protein
MKTIDKLSFNGAFGISTKLSKNICILFCGLSFLSLLSESAFAKSTDVGVCFLKAQPQTMQSKINEIASNGQENARIQQQVKNFNDLTNLFVPIDTFNYKIFWVQRPNNEWLTQNCFKFGYITLMDYNRRAITRVYSTPSNFVEENSRMPASTKEAIPKADPPAKVAVEEKPAFDPQANQQNSNGYAVPQINLYQYYGSDGKPALDSSVPPKKQEDLSKKEDNLNVNVNVGNANKDDGGDNLSRIRTREKSIYDVPSYLEEPTYFFEFSPFMGYENANTKGAGATNKYNIFGYGADLKFGYRPNQYFNYYFKGRYLSIEERSVKSPASLALNKNTDFTYGIGIEHVASRFLSLALEYNALQIQSFEQVLILTDVVSKQENIQTLNLDFKLNFISRDDFKFGLHGNYGIVLADNSDNLVYDFKTKLFLLRVFNGDYFGMNLGYEQNKFFYASGITSETTRQRYVFGLNYGFDF